jgi:integrase
MTSRQTATSTALELRTDESEASMTTTQSTALVAPSSALDRPTARRALDQAIAFWLDAKSGRSGSLKTATTYQDTIAQFRSALQAAGLDLDADSRAVALAAQRWAAQRATNSRGSGDVSPSTYNQRLAVLSSFYKYARKLGLFTNENPIDRVERRSVQAYASAVPIDKVTLRTRLKDISRDDQAGQRDYALLAIYVNTGRRLSEVAALRWSDIHQAGDRVTLHFRHAKGGKVMSDTLPPGISKALMTWLTTCYGNQLAQLTPEQPIWVSLSTNGTAGDALGIRAVAQICADRLGVSKVHALRHTFAHMMEDAGAKTSEIQARLGHSSMATTGRYLAALRAAENPYADTLAQQLGLDD